MYITSTYIHVYCMGLALAFHFVILDNLWYTVFDENCFWFEKMLFFCHSCCCCCFFSFLCIFFSGLGGRGQESSYGFICSSTSLFFGHPLLIYLSCQPRNSFASSYRVMKVFAINSATPPPPCHPAATLQILP